MKILLSPAKNLDFSRTVEASGTTSPVFLKEAEGLAKKLGKFSAKKIEKMMHLSKDLASLNYDRYQTWEPATELNDNTGHAVSVFNGEVYRGLDAVSMTQGEIDWAQDHLRILSGLYGILKPLDVIHPYRLEMGTSWAVTPKKTNLYKFWGTSIADELNAEEGGDS